MRFHKAVAVVAATLVAVLLPPAAAAAAGGTRVSVRIERLHGTLLPASTVPTHTGSITKGGAPAGVCPATSAAGGLDVATRHRWDATYNQKYAALEVISILGERHTFSSPYFWEIFLNDVPAQLGACGLTLHRGDRLLFAASSTKNTTYALVLRAPAGSGRADPSASPWCGWRAPARPRRSPART